MLIRPQVIRPRPRPQPPYCYRILGQNKTSDVIYLLMQSVIVNNDKNNITVITSAIIF